MRNEVSLSARGPLPCWRAWPVSSNGTVASQPAQGRMAPAPPGCCKRKFVTSYTTPRTITQQSSGRLCEATAAAEWTVLAGISEATRSLLYLRGYEYMYLYYPHTPTRVQEIKGYVNFILCVCCVCMLAVELYSRMGMILWVLCSRGFRSRAVHETSPWCLGAHSRARGATAGARRRRYRALRAAKATC